MNRLCTLAASVVLLALAGTAPAATDLPGVFECVDIGRSSAELLVPAEAKFNPYDPADIAIDATLRYPSGEKERLPCFWHVPARPVYQKGRGDEGQPVLWERFAPTGEGSWRFRFAPPAPGRYAYSYTVRMGRRQWSLAGGEFLVGKARTAHPGPIQTTPGGTVFQYANGRPFIPLGHNLGWPTESGTKVYGEWLRRLGEAGGNCGRLWLTHYYTGTRLEWSASVRNSGFEGAGRYSIESAARLDRILAQARRHGIFLILTFSSFGDLSQDWAKHPYNRQAGGWLETPREFFSDRRARQAVKNHLRYLVARYGWSPNVWAWELWNEVDSSEGYEEAAVLAWHREMAAYLKQVDIHRRLVATSYRYTPPFSSCAAYQLEDIDFTQIHSYLPRLVNIFPRRLQALRGYGKPAIIAEFGLFSAPTYFDADPAGLHLHDGLWAAVFGGAAGGGMSWWWDKYIDARELYFHYTGISRFLAGEDLAGAEVFTSEPRPGEQSFSMALRLPNKFLAWVGTPRQTGAGNEALMSEVKRYTAKTPAGPFEMLVDTGMQGPHVIIFYDTFDGVEIARQKAESDENGLLIRVPRFRHDVAIKCMLAEDAPEPPGNARPATPIHDRFEKLILAYARQKARQQ